MSIEYKCELCEAEKGEPCRNTIHPGEPLPLDRVEHHARALPSDDTARRRKAKR